MVDAFEDMADFPREMMDAISSIGGPGAAAIDDSIITRDFKEDGSLKGETALRSAKRQIIDPDAFESPSGYKRQKMFGDK